MQDELIPWRTRLLMFYAAAATVLTGRHVYLSTGCIAGRHDYCTQMIGLAGEKTPGRSKFSGASCICWCHAR